MAHRERLLRFYQKYNADKLHEIDGVLERFKGKEASLFAALVKKYGPEPSADEVLTAPAPSAKKSDKKKDVAAAAVPESKAVKDFNHARLLAFYKKYNPEKVGDVETDDDDEDDNGVPKFKTVVYCPVDSLPPEYCEYGPLFNDCKPWLAEHCPNLWLTKYNRTVEDFLEAERQIAAGVEGISLEAEGPGKTVKKKGKKKQEEFKNKANAVVYISKSSRKGRKRLTFVTGLEDFEGVNIKDASKSLGKRFACSSSLSKTDAGKQQIQLQGDCIVELMEVLPEMFGISEDKIVVVDEPVKGKK
uniref:SUI1 domain-containing protein n=1 Tax=Globisporangium ultimum (strain ATCC 200006 / CBS 805.95 / DAOM BR144) TaxID=431595 RepID=K3WSK7_GLOUD